MKRAFLLLALIALVAAMTAAFSPSFADSEDVALTASGVYAVAVPSASLAVPDPINGETEFFDPVTFEGLCCAFGGTCTGATSFVAGDTMIFNDYWTDTATATSMTFTVRNGVAPTPNLSAVVDLFEGPITYNGLTPGTTYTFCVGITVDPVPQTPPLCNWFSGYTVDGIPNGIGKHLPLGQLDVNCP